MHIVLYMNYTKNSDNKVSGDFFLPVSSVFQRVTTIVQYVDSRNHWVGGRGGGGWRGRVLFIRYDA
jgi:hypothetical protein